MVTEHKLQNYQENRPDLEQNIIIALSKELQIWRGYI